MSTVRTAVRHSVIATSFAIVGIASVLTLRAGALHASSEPTASTTIEPSSRWLKSIKGKHRQFFDAPAPAGGVPLVHLMNYYDTYNQAFGVKDDDIAAVLTFYGATTFYGLNDAVWAKYRLGEFLETNDPTTGQPATSNPWRVSPVVLGMTLPAASLESLHKRGATLILCNNALQIFSGLLAAKRGLDSHAVYEDLKANMLPGVELIPGMVIAVEQAARVGMSYHRQ